MFIDEIAKIDGACDFQQSRLRRSLSEGETQLYEYIDQYLYDYCKFCRFSPIDVIQARGKFVSSYQQDLLGYEKYRKYPYQLEIPQTIKLTRVEYDVILILSFLIEKHRFRIASWLSGRAFEKSVLCVGVGPGVELGILKEFHGSATLQVLGFDLEVSEFVANRYGASVHQGHFSPDRKRYDAILLIEILEHLPNPESLIRSASQALKPGGQIVLTTAIDIPQFDHLYNFAPEEIIGLLSKSGLAVEELLKVEHVLNIRTVSSANELVVARKPNDK
jgi:2-polyprenyl-3-methyl-5-hydroxy-6-metoxy-1,4-benzoquinol methylase